MLCKEVLSICLAFEHLNVCVQPETDNGDIDI